MKIEIISSRVPTLGAPGDTVDVDPDFPDLGSLIEAGHVKPQKTPTKKDKE